MFGHFSFGACSTFPDPLVIDILPRLFGIWHNYFYTYYCWFCVDSTFENSRNKAIYENFSRSLRVRKILSLKDLSVVVGKILENVGDRTLTEKDENKYFAKEAVKIFKPTAKKIFGQRLAIHVKVNDDIIVDVVAGTHTTKLCKDLKFSDPLFLQLYEVYEGWVHFGTIVNGLSRKRFYLLTKGPPSISALL